MIYSTNKLCFKKKSIIQNTKNKKDIFTTLVIFIKNNKYYVLSLLIFFIIIYKYWPIDKYWNPIIYKIPKNISAQNQNQSIIISNSENIEDQTKNIKDKFENINDEIRQLIEETQKGAIKFNSNIPNKSNIEKLLYDKILNFRKKYQQYYDKIKNLNKYYKAELEKNPQLKKNIQLQFNRETIIKSYELKNNSTSITDNIIDKLCLKFTKNQLVHNFLDKDIKVFDLNAVLLKIINNCNDDSEKNKIQFFIYFWNYLFTKIQDPLFFSTNNWIQDLRYIQDFFQSLQEQNT